MSPYPPRARFAPSSPPGRRRKLGVRGAAMTEYIVLVGTVALGASVALIGLGVAFINLFDTHQSLLLMPFP